jgi:hypothetical protein
MEKAVELIFMEECCEDIDSSLMEYVRRSNDAMSFVACTVVSEMMSAVNDDHTIRVENYYENTVPSYSDASFRAHFRVSRRAIGVRYSQHSSTTITFDNDRL